MLIYGCCCARTSTYLALKFFLAAPPVAVAGRFGGSGNSPDLAPAEAESDCEMGGGVEPTESGGGGVDAVSERDGGGVTPASLGGIGGGVES